MGKKDDSANNGWQVESGGKDDFSGAITSSRFGYDDNYNNGESLLLKWEVEDDEDGELVEVSLPCGKGWDQADTKGKRCEYPGKPKKSFNERSMIGKLIQLAIGDEGEETSDGLECWGIGPELMKRGSGFDAAVWEGLHLHFKRVEFNYGTRKDDEGNEVPMTSNRIFPIGFLGFSKDEEESKSVKKPAKKPAKDEDEDDGDDEAEAKPAKKTAKKPTKKSDPEPDTDTDADSEPEGYLALYSKKTQAKLKSAFKKCDGDFDSFLEAALEMDEIQESDELMEYATDEDKLFAELLDA